MFSFASPFNDHCLTWLSYYRRHLLETWAFLQTFFLWEWKNERYQLDIFPGCLERHFLRRQPLNWVNETTVGTWPASYIIYRSTRFSLARAVFFLRKVSCKVLKLHYVGEGRSSSTPLRWLTPWASLTLETETTRLKRWFRFQIS